MSDPPMTAPTTGATERLRAELESYGYERASEVGAMEMAGIAEVEEHAQNAARLLEQIIAAAVPDAEVMGKAARVVIAAREWREAEAAEHPNLSEELRILGAITELIDSIDAITDDDIRHLAGDAARTEEGEGLTSISLSDGPT